MPRLPSLLLLAVVLATPGCIIYAPTNLGGLGFAGLQEEVLEEADSFWTRDRIAVVHVEGVLDQDSVSALVERLQAVEEDDRVRAVVLRIDSPGGEVTASDQMHRELLAFKQRTRLPVLAMLMRVAASGGYYVAMAADEVMAHPTSITGSIGVIARVFDVAGLLELVGVRQHTLTTGVHKDMGSPFRPLTDEERALFQDIVDAHFERFLEVVDAGRPGLDGEQVRALADGRVFPAGKALEAGLVDHLGYLDDVLARALRAARIDDAEVVGYRVGRGFRSNLYGATAPDALPRADGPAVELDLGLDRLLPEPGVHFLYLWEP